MSNENCHSSTTPEATAAATEAATATAAVTKRRLELNPKLREALEVTTAAARIRAQTTTPRIRKDIRQLSDMEVNLLRNAYEGLYSISNPNDQRGYEWIAGRHGYPGNYCHTNESDFYVWHRAYMYEFEERLRDAQVRQTGTASVTLPYWDWTLVDPVKDDATGIPKVCSEPTYTDLLTGETKDNPLFSAYSIATGKKTTRSPGQLAAYVNQRKRQVDDALADPDFISAQSKINFGPHGNVHIYTGGDMRSIRTAAFDPIFYFHHAMIDRIWWLWQRRHGNSTVPAAQRAFVAAPWSYTGEQCLDAAGFFHYTYRQVELFRPFDSARLGDAALVKARKAAAVTVPLGDLEGGFEHARLRFHNMKKTEGSYEVRVFLNQKSPSEKTRTDGNPRYAGSFYVFGHGECIGEVGHCDVTERRPFDRRPAHHYTPFTTAMDVTPAALAVAGTAKAKAGAPVEVSFVVLDTDGTPVAPAEFSFEGLSLETT
jgi:tyrosinase